MYSLTIRQFYDPDLMHTDTILLYWRIRDELYIYALKLYKTFLLMLIAYLIV